MWAQGYPNPFSASWCESIVEIFSSLFTTFHEEASSSTGRKNTKWDLLMQDFFKCRYLCCSPAAQPYIPGAGINEMTGSLQCGLLTPLAHRPHAHGRGLNPWSWDRWSFQSLVRSKGGLGRGRRCCKVPRTLSGVRHFAALADLLHPFKTMSGLCCRLKGSKMHCTVFEQVFVNERFYCRWQMFALIQIGNALQRCVRACSHSTEVLWWFSRASSETIPLLILVMSSKSHANIRKCFNILVDNFWQGFLQEDQKEDLYNFT